MRNISSWSIRNPVPTILLFLVLTRPGRALFPRLGGRLVPDTHTHRVSL